MDAPAQAKLIRAVPAKLDVERPTIVGHSMGTMVAVALALEYPDDVRSLVLLGGYYYPSARLDALMTHAGEGLAGVCSWVTLCATRSPRLQAARC